MVEFKTWENLNILIGYLIKDTQILIKDKQEIEV